MKIIEGSFSVPSRPVAIVAARFNALVVERLVEGARDAFVRHGVPDDSIDLIRVPGAWELATVVRRLVQQGRHAALVALGCVIRGDTPHFDQVVASTTRALGELSMTSDIPVVFGVLTTDDLDQALQRAGAKAGNKGFDAAVTALEMADLLRRLEAQ